MVVARKLGVTNSRRPTGQERGETEGRGSAKKGKSYKRGTSLDDGHQTPQHEGTCKRRACAFRIRTVLPLSLLYLSLSLCLSLLVRSFDTSTIHAFFSLQVFAITILLALIATTYGEYLLTSERGD